MSGDMESEVSGHMGKGRVRSLGNGAGQVTCDRDWSGHMGMGHVLSNKNGTSQVTWEWDGSIT